VSTGPYAFEGVRTQVRTLMREESIPSISIAVAQDGAIIWEESFGCADLTTSRPASPGTRYSLASVTKPITSTALMTLVERGEIDLDRPIDDYLGQHKLRAPLDHANEATVRRVANHTAGLPKHYQFFYDDINITPPSQEEFIQRHGLLVTVPGEIFVYSNIGYALLEYAIERVSGMSFAAFLTTEIFEPLRLRGISPVECVQQADAAVRYHDGHQVPFYDFAHRGASSVFMSAHDLVRFGIFHLNGWVDGQARRDLRQDSLQTMLASPVSTGAPLPEKSHYGLGWTLGEKHGLRRFGHTGSMPGVAARLFMYPQENIAIAILANAETPRLDEVEDRIVGSLLQSVTIDSGNPQWPGELTGLWTGFVTTNDTRSPIELEIKGPGRVEVKVSKLTHSRALRATFDARTAFLTVTGIMGDIGCADAARHPYELHFHLKLRDLNTLNGSVTAVSFAMQDRWGSALSYWTELQRYN